MNCFNCYYYFFNFFNELERNSNTSCWAGIKSEEEQIKRKLGYGAFHWEHVDYIYIKVLENKNYKLDKNFLKRKVNLINNITECSIVNLDNKTYVNRGSIEHFNNQDENKNGEFIKYKLLKRKSYSKSEYYSKNLVLLNIIRMLWYQPHLFNLKGFHKSILKRVPRGKDSLWFLMENIRINIDSSKKTRGNYGDHSCIYPKIIPKTKKWFLDCDKTSCQAIMISIG
tara:strand:+ start:13597 stop:14274 length:678 start_codon:yes stop_codon:yes gene_type:complete